MNINGKSIQISKGQIIVDGVKLKDSDVKIINIVGEVETLNADVCESITVEGNVGSVHTAQGDITIKGSAIEGVKTNQGDINVGESIIGNATTNMGDIKVEGDIFGKPKTSMGDIKGKKIYIE